MFESHSFRVCFFVSNPPIRPLVRLRSCRLVLHAIFRASRCEVSQQHEVENLPLPPYPYLFFCDIDSLKTTNSCPSLLFLVPVQSQDFIIILCVRAPVDSLYVEESGLTVF